MSRYDFLTSALTLGPVRTRCVARTVGADVLVTVESSAVQAT
ncbi:hypothetical protein [Streptomyces sp. JW3]